MSEWPEWWRVPGPETVRASFFWMFVLAHVLGDFVFQSGAILRGRREACRLDPDSPAVGSPERSVPSVGFYVGMLERALILTFLLFEAPAAVGFVVAAKSVARFKELEDRAFAEYYLVGTLMSVVVAMGGYLLLRQPL